MKMLGRRLLSWLAVSLWFAVLGATLVAAVGLANAADPRGRDFGYQAPDVAEWFGSLRQPDAPAVSCCGEPDAYEADRVDGCRPSDGADCALVAIITDTRPDEPRRRPHVDVGTRVPIPERKIRRRPSANPTDHSIVFAKFHEFGHMVYCWEPATGI